MPFVKVIKSKSYFKRYQVKFRRRREGKTDYRARKRLTIQDKNKYNTPRYRFVVRITNKDVICQFVRALIVGDEVVCAAYAHELPRYGIPTGLTNYSAAYATGLLAARRLLTKFGLADKYQGQVEATGEDYNVEPLEDGPRPFKAFLDVGLVRTTTGHRVFACLKGALDGGVDIPHSETRFCGFDKEKKKLDAEVLREHIFGQHVAEYMNTMKDEEPQKYQEQFAKYVEAEVEGDDLEDLYKNAHAAIRADPSSKLTEKKVPEVQKRFHQVRRSLQQRKDRVRQRKEQIAKKLAAGAE
mmetsp:Transcript_2248/g.6074  ORF Transcript_2248/g.6074 Transcript_2248/m.6074 type:complete len:298 (-) Transcript_2248:157-1050(-)